MTYISHVYDAVAPAFLITVTVVRIFLISRSWLQASSLLSYVHDTGREWIVDSIWSDGYKQAYSSIKYSLRPMFLLDFAALVTILVSIFVSLEYALLYGESSPGFYIPGVVSTGYSIGVIFSLALLLSVYHRLEVAEKFVIGDVKLKGYSLFWVSLDRENDQ